MPSGQSVQACPCRVVPTDHEARGQRSGGCKERAGAPISALLKSGDDSASAEARPRGRSSTREAREPHTQALSDGERTSARRQRARNLHALRAEEGTAWCWSSRPRAAREGVEGVSTCTGEQFARQLMECHENVMQGVTNTQEQSCSTNKHL